MYHSYLKNKKPTVNASGVGCSIKIPFGRSNLQIQSDNYRLAQPVHLNVSSPNQSEFTQLGNLPTSQSNSSDQSLQLISKSHRTQYPSPKCTIPSTNQSTVASDNRGCYSQFRPTAPLPSRKQRPISPLYTGDQVVDVTHASWSKQHIGNAFDCQENLNHSIFTGDNINNSSNPIGLITTASSSYLSNRNSWGSSDLTTPNSPNRSPHTATIHTEMPLGSTAALGLHTSSQQQRSYYRAEPFPNRGENLSNRSEHFTNVYTYSPPVHQSGSGLIRLNATTSPRFQNLGSKQQTQQQQQKNQESLADDSGGEMTVSELRSIAERQRQQLARQAQQLQLKEERRAWLRSIHSHNFSQKKSTNVQTELTHEQEMKLHKLRGFRGQTEQSRLTNENLMKEISQLTRILTAHEHDLHVYEQKILDSERVLKLIDKWRVLINKSYQLSKLLNAAQPLSDALSAVGDLSLPFMQPPFQTDVDKKRWHDGLLEADRLDRQYAVKFGRKLPMQSWLLANTNQHNSAQCGSVTGTMNPNDLNNQSAPYSYAVTSSPKLLRDDLTSNNIVSKIQKRATDTDVRVHQPQQQVHNQFAGVQSDSEKVTGSSATPLAISLDSTPNTQSESTASSPRSPSACTSSFVTLLGKTTSPPTTRRSSLRTILHTTNATSNWRPGKEGITHIASHPVTCPRLKNPPRYASRAVINDTYMRRVCRDSVEKYKRTASEIYLANVNKISAKPTVSSELSDDAITGKLPSIELHVIATSPEPVQLDSNQLVSGSTSSSSSSLELIGLEIQSDVPHAVRNIQSAEEDEVDDDLKQNSGDLDSGIGGSDQTVQIETLNEPHTARNNVSPEHNLNPVIYVDEEHGTDLSTSNASAYLTDSRQLRPILRKTKPKPDFISKTTVTTDAIQSETTQSLVSSPSQSNSVKFHPLALLLDAALEGDLELVKKAAAEVSDVSEPNDEGITALHNAVCAGRIDVAEFLVLVAGADVNAGDTDGWTPLHCAASCGNLPLARLLVEHGASLHARTLSDQETPLEKCDQGDEEAECEEYLYFQQERLGTAASGKVYVLFPRGLEAAGPGSADAYLEPDELPVWPNEQITIVNREPPGEIEWMLAEKSDGQRGLIPRSHISCYPLVRIPPASLPIPEQSPSDRMKATALWMNNVDYADDECPGHTVQELNTTQVVVEIEDLPTGSELNKSDTNHAGFTTHQISENYTPRTDDSHSSAEIEI